MADKITTPAGFGGLINYGEEYDSKLKLKPEHVIIFIVLVIILVTILKIFFPL